MNVLRKSLYALVALGLMATTLFSATSSVSASSLNGTCQNVTMPVSLAPGLPSNQTLSGTFCRPNTWAPGAKQVDVLVHGATYDRSYWDFSVAYPQYSYVDRTLQAGRATFAYDRLGVGQSSRPLSALATIEADAHGLHQVIQWVRATSDNFGKVRTAGHSIGSSVVITEAAAYHDTDGVVITGLIHSLGNKAPEASASLYPAALDPQFIEQTLDLGYLTTLPGARSPIFYAGATDSAVIAYDEAHKAMVPGLQLGTIPSFITPPLLNVSTHITAPVYSIIGQHDGLFCNLTTVCNDATVQAQETPYYPNAASFSSKTVLNTGHNLTLHPSAGTSFNAINQWIQAH